jgi:hypothetical protein
MTGGAFEVDFASRGAMASLSAEAMARIEAEASQRDDRKLPRDLVRRIRQNHADSPRYAPWEAETRDLLTQAYEEDCAAIPTMDGVELL